MKFDSLGLIHGGVESNEMMSISMYHAAIVSALDAVNYRDYPSPESALDILGYKPWDNLSLS